MNRTKVTLPPDVELELLESPQGEFLGIGSVSVGGVALRSDARPILVRLDTPDGILYTRLTRVSIDDEPGGAVCVRLRATGTRWGRGEYADDYDQAVVWLSPSAEPVTDELTLLLAPVSLDLGGRTWRGFSYAFRFRGDAQVSAIHRLLVHATWEIGGTIAGNTVLSQGQCNMPAYRGAADALFTTACLRTLDGYGSPQGNSFQLGPRGGLLQGFDFQYADAGALLQYWPKFTSISSLLESPPGSDLLHVVDEYRFPLASDVTTTPKHVLFAPGPLAEHEARDLWWDAYEHVYGGIRAAYGVKPSVVLPETGLKYSTRVHEGRLRMTVGGEEVDSTDVPYAIAERVLPRLAEQGVKRFFPEVMSESDVSVVGMRRKLDAGVHGDLHCASVCATHRFFPSEFWGGIKAWRAMYDKAQQLGIDLGAWFAPHFSPRSPIFASHPEYRMISVTGLPAGGGYGFQTIVVADWNTGIYDWVLADLKRWKEEGGLDHLFVDSLSNMGLLQMNYTAAMQTNFDALGRLFADIQALGIGAFTCECVSPFMASRFGLADLRGDLLEQNRAVAGQNDWGWWLGEEDMAYGIGMMVAARKRTEEEMARSLFRVLANRGAICYENQLDGSHTLFPEWARLNHVYNQALPHMRTRRMLPGRAGTLWTDGAVQVVWAYRDGELPVDPGATVVRLLGKDAEPVAHDGTLRLAGGSVYRIS